MNQLTSQEMTKVFGMYLHEDVRVQTDEGIMHLVGVNAFYNTVDVCESYDSVEPHYKPIEEVKLSLLQLSSISDEHAIEVVKICGYNSQLLQDERTFNDIVKEVDIDEEDIDRQPTHIIIPFTHGCFCGHLTICFNGEIFVTEEDGKQDYVSSLNFAHHFLSKQFYALPIWLGIDHWANGKTPIELGVAIVKS